MTRTMSGIGLLVLGLFISIPIAAQNSPCRFDSVKLEFVGSPTAQARCLLRPNRIGGVLGKEPAKLPSPLEQLIGKDTPISKAALARYLARRDIATETIGGPIEKPLATGIIPGAGAKTAAYFVIHDTSHPFLGDTDFPEGFDSDPMWKGNDLSIWTNQPVAHIFVDRLGRSLTTTPFDEPVRKGFGTKFARDFLKGDAKGLQIHIELVQPRRRDPSDSNPKNDRIAPNPGFTTEQYEKLALLYLAASVRRGSWLIPGFHSAYDAGIKDAHDDPQNFDLKQFAKALAKLIKSIK